MNEEQDDELMWVKAGEPGEKPLIIRQVRTESSSSSSRDNSGGSTASQRLRKHILNDISLKTFNNENYELFNTSSNNTSQVIVVNVNESNYIRSCSIDRDKSIDREKAKRWRELQSPRSSKKHFQNNNNNLSPHIFHNTKGLQMTRKKSKSQPVNLIAPHSPIVSTKSCLNKDRLQCHSLDRKTQSLDRVSKIKSNDEGYTSLSEDCKDSDNESVRSKSFPSSWKPMFLKEKEYNNLSSYAKRLATEQDQTVNFLPCEIVSCDFNKKHKRKQKKRRHYAESAIEISTCFICLRSAFYHTHDEDDINSSVDHPCECRPRNRFCCGRWALIGVMVCFFPLLIFYPPLKLTLYIHDKRIKRKKHRAEKRQLRKVL